MKDIFVALVLLLWLGLALPTAAQIPDGNAMSPAHRLRQFLIENVPADSPLKSNEGFARQELTRLDHLEYARPLRFFEPLQLVAVVLMHPLGGTPGQVLEDIRVVYDPEEVTFAFSSIEWINAYREQVPLSPETLSEEDMKAYIEEVGSLLPGVDRWGFRVTDLEPTSHLGYRMRFDEPHEMSGIGGGITEIRFTPTGGIASCPFLEDQDPTR